MKIKYLILSIFLFCTSLLLGQDVKFTASVSEATVGTGAQFEITFSLNGNGDRFNPPGFQNFQVLSGPNVSTSMESINGNTTVSNSYNYILMAVKEGDFTIGPATIVVNGHRLSTSAVKIKVIKGQPVAKGSQPKSGPDESVTEGGSADLAKSVFLRAILDKNNVYQGQQIILDFRLYTRVDITQSQVDNIPDLNGFWNEDIKSRQPQVQWHVETYKGVRYNAADIKQTILFPEHSGNITIDPMKMTFILRVQAPSNNIMDQFFGSYKEVKYKVKSAPLAVHVKPLPNAGKPPGFTGAVGSFNIESSIDKTELKANEPLNYKVKITGAGNIKLLNAVNTNFPADFEKYDPRITDTITEDGSGVSGNRVYNYLLIPRHEGTFTIDPLKFSYFNPATGSYTIINTKAFHIKVNKGSAGSNVTTFSGAYKQDVQILAKDIRYIKTGAANFNKRGNSFYASFWYYFLLVIGPVGCCGAYIYRNRLRKYNSDLTQVKSRRAGKVAAKHLASAQKQLQARNSKAFYEDVSKGLYGYLSDKLGIQYANLDRENILSALKERKTGEQITFRLLNTLDLCEMARYAPVTHISENEVFEKAKGIINDMENER